MVRDIRTCPSPPTATKERAVAVALVSAAITRDIAVCCREEKLKDCPCAKPEWSRKTGEDDNGERTVTYADCGDNVEIAKIRTKKILEVSSEDKSLEGKIDYHNVCVGTQVRTLL